jgi:addiction module HigA family antidote
MRWSTRIIIDALHKRTYKRRGLTEMRARKRQPVHPGRILRNHHLDPLSMKIAELANVLGVSRKTVSKLASEQGSITPDMALRLSRAFGTSPDLWMNLQKNYDLWHASTHSGDWKRVQIRKLSGPMQDSA